MAILKRNKSVYTTQRRALQGTNVPLMYDLQLLENILPDSLNESDRSVLDITQAGRSDSADAVVF